MLLFVILFLLFPLNLYSLDLTVKTSYEGTPLSRAKIKIWHKAAMVNSDKPDYTSTADENGISKIALNSGEYYIFGEKNVDNELFFGFYGQNPLSLKKNSEITINLVKYPMKPLITKKGNSISGIVTHKGKPLSNVNVFAYLDLTSDLKGPAYLSSVTDENGRFVLELDKGSYFLVFRKKREDYFGLPSPGDYVGVFPIFPLEVKDTGYELYVSLLKIPEKMKKNLQDKSYVIKGKVLNKNEKPVKGVYVVLYEDYTLLGKPDYVSHITDQTGSFTLYVKNSGSYFVVVRKSLGDTPQLGEDVSSLAEITVGDETIEKEFVIKTNN